MERNVGEGTEVLADENSFDWRNVRWPPLYPSPDILAEMGRITIAAARVDRQLALVLLAVKYSKDFHALLKKNSSELLGALKTRLSELFEGSLFEPTATNLDEVQRIIEVRHAVAHSIWSPGQDNELLSVELILGIRSQEEVDRLLLERGSSAAWTTLHPKTGASGPQTLEQLQKARKNLEDAAEWLEGLRFTLASALFAGKPKGARRVLHPRDFQREPS